jgi:tetratricopeptide (TPR) repeat protein
VADMPRAVISSTTHDLPRHRDAARDACLRQDFFPEMMEHLAPSPADAVRLSRELVNQADVYILILGFRYGEVPQGQEKSYTHLELDRADERGIPKLVFLMADDHPLTIADVETGAGAERVRALRERLRRKQAVSFFSSPEQLRALLIDGLSDIRSRLRPREAAFHHVRHIVAPPEPYIAHPYTLLQTSEVIGRQRELNVLTDWGTGAGPARVMIFVAIGGIGKSAVTWKWFNEVAPQELRPLAGRVWWSFYESDARFGNFVARTLAYVSDLTLEEVAEMRAPEQADELLAVLDREPYLIVLDGLERLLIAYARPDAAHLADDEVDKLMASAAAHSLGLPTGAAASFTGQSRLRMTADPQVGDFLRRLATVRASRILGTSRLFPTDLQTVTGDPVSGATAYFVDGLGDDDAVNLWRAFGVTGTSQDLIELFHTFGNYPLLIRALAGEVARYRPAPRDFDRWRRAHAGFNPFRMSLVQRKSHVLQYALSGLTDAENRVLRTIAAFRSPAVYDTLAALLAGPGKPCPDEAGLDVILSDLEDRGLLGWDRRGNRYDLHPLVRGVAWSALDPDSKQDIYQDLASHFEALPRMDEDEVTSIDDLAGEIELYHTLVQLGRAKDAYDILGERIFGSAIERIGAFHEVAELVELLATRLDLMQELEEEGGDRTQAMMAALGICHYFCDDPVRALAAFSRLGEEFRKEDEHIFSLRSTVLCQIGALAEAERAARESVNVMQGSIDANHFIDIPIIALATVRIRCGKYDEARTWLSDYRVQMALADDFLTATMATSECALAALRQNDIPGAQAFAERMATISAESGMPRARVQAMAISAAAAEAQGEHDQAYDLLNEALVIAREARMPDTEAGLLVQLGYWNARAGRLDAARAHAADAQHVAERGQLRLRQADAVNLFSSIERARGNRHESAAAAAEAYRLAWCDGPPFAYEWGIRQARENLAAAGEPEPSGLPARSVQMPELEIAPISLAGALTLRHALPDGTLIQVIRQLPRSADSVASLRALQGSAISRQVRQAIDLQLIWLEDR